MLLVSQSPILFTLLRLDRRFERVASSPMRLFIAGSERICWALVVGSMGRLRGTKPIGHGPAGWRQRARLANSAASGCAAANAIRTRLAGSRMRGAILVRSLPKVVNSD